MNGSTSGTRDISVNLFYQNYIAGDGNVDHSWECWLYSVKGAGIDPFNRVLVGQCVAYFEGGNHFDNSGGRRVNAGRIDRMASIWID